MCLCEVIHGFPRISFLASRRLRVYTRLPPVATAGEYFDTVLPGVKSGTIQIPILRGGTGYTYDSFWIENPRVKTWYRKNEHGLQAAPRIDFRFDRNRS